MNYATECEGNFEDELFESITLVRRLITDFEDDTGGPAGHVVIPKSLEIQSVVMYVCDMEGLTYELSDDTDEVYCTG